MTPLFLALTLLCALIDWVAVARQNHRLEYIAKPLTMVLLIVAAVAADLGAATPWVLAGLVLGLLGDIALMLRASETRENLYFLFGLGAFLLGHLAYVPGFLVHGVTGGALLIGAAITVALLLLVMPRIIVGAYRRDGAVLAGLVGLYALVIALMVITAVGTGNIILGIGGVLFAISDSILGHQRFVRPLRGGSVILIAAYHLAQILFVLGLFLAVTPT